MKTITKTLAGLGLAAIGLAGCADSNEKINTPDGAGKATVGVTPPGTPTTSEGAMKSYQGAMQKSDSKAKDYKDATNQNNK